MLILVPIFFPSLLASYSLHPTPPNCSLTYMQPTCNHLKVIANDDSMPAPKNVPVTISVLDNDVPAIAGMTLIATTLLSEGLDGK